MLGSLRHPNIVELLNCYTQNGITNMLFPRADLDLHDFLLEKQRPRPFEHDHIFFNAMRGVASGLSYLHNFRPRADPLDTDPCGPMHGCHHDIKPRNILVYGAVLVLADFGFSKMKSISEDTQTRWKDTTFEYGAPECRDAQSFVAGMVGRTSDIWSIGCVFSEVAAYIEQGEPGVQRFRQGRTVDAEHGKQRCFHDGQALSSNVDRYIRDLEETTKSTSTENLIRLIRKTLSRSDRPKAEEVEMELLHCALISVLDGLLEIIKRISAANMGSIDRNLFETRLSLERNRLIAWGDSLGIKPFDDREKAMDGQTAFLGPGFYTTLKSTFDALTSTCEFKTLEDDNDFKLNVLRQANDDLCRHLAERTRFSIDQTFCMISTSSSDTSLRRQIATLDIIGDTEKVASAVAAMKYMSILLERKIPEPVKNCRIEKSLLELGPSKGDEASLGPQTWFYSYGHRPNEKRKTLVEYTPYWERQIRDSESQEFHDAIDAMFERVQELAAMLKISPKPAELRVLDCLGSFHDPERQRFALVYALPCNNSRPIRLNKLMRHGNSHLVYPELGEKLALAKALVACIQSFHGSGWIHKGLCSMNVLFLLDDAVDWKDIRFGEPFIVGFDHSRKDGKGHYTQGPILLSGSQEYLHPEYRAGLKEAKKSYDYYSMGVVLLEIGLWMSISNIYNQPRYRKYSPEALREEYINVCNRDLGKTMGSIYQSVTSTCLDYGSGTKSLEDQFQFQTDVVDRLNMCRFDIDI